MIKVIDLAILQKLYSFANITLDIHDANLAHAKVSHCKSL